MTLYLARHGRSVGQGLFLGQSDPGLSEEGHAQAEALAERLAGVGIGRILCSPLKRSAETAVTVSLRLDTAVDQDPRLSEIGYGHWDGLAWDEIERRWPQEAQRKLADWWGVTPEGGEAREQFLLRVGACWNEIRSAGLPVLIVGHAGVNGLISELARGCEVDWSRVTRFEQAYGAVLEIEVE